MLYVPVQQQNSYCVDPCCAEYRSLWYASLDFEAISKNIEDDNYMQLAMKRVNPPRLTERKEALRCLLPNAWAIPPKSLGNTVLDLGERSLWCLGNVCGVCELGNGFSSDQL